ncbi:MAG TPA: molybdate ABC transporter substrate-binding protein [Xanthobacteraceae bacterium]|jgi:molybdate transport system substrate-binding protein|nr:molybdate ABC transporter substrate-binding protein [Xanthobacteraceae bacterium]
MSALYRAASIGLCTALLLAFGVPAQAQNQTITVFAAASMKDALDAADKAYMQDHKDKVVVSYTASSALAKQIEQGAPADLFISADVQWMDYVAKAKLIDPGRRVNLLGNTLVMIAPDDSKLSNIKIDSSLDLAKLTSGGRIAVADTKAVPAGLYTKAAFEKLGLWSKAEPQLAQAENVRAALALVARAEAPIGVVYSTDAKAEPKVKIVGTFPANSHPAIIYPVAVTAKAKPATGAYYDFLRSDKAKAIFTQYGFAVLNSGS